MIASSRALLLGHHKGEVTSRVIICKYTAGTQSKLERQQNQDKDWPCSPKNVVVVVVVVVVEKDEDEDSFVGRVERLRMRRRKKEKKKVPRDYSKPFLSVNP